MKPRASKAASKTSLPPSKAPSTRAAGRRGLLDGDHGAPGGAAPELVAAQVWASSSINAKGEVVEAAETVNRRLGSPLVARLARPSREAAEAYATAFEVVSAGGVTGGGTSEKTDGSAGGREGRQAGALAWAERLRLLDVAIGSGLVRLDARGRAIPVLLLVRKVIIGGMSLARVLDSIGMKRTAPRERAMRAAIEGGLFRAALALGLEKPTSSEKAVDK